jgi:hypothetical protein
MKVAVVLEMLEVPGLAGLEAGRFGGWVLLRRRSKMVRGCTIGLPEGALVK